MPAEGDDASRAGIKAAARRKNPVPAFHSGLLEFSSSGLNCFRSSSSRRAISPLE